MTQLQSFAARALRQLPTSLWWLLAALVGAFASIKLEKELFPNTPAAATAAGWIAMVCLLALPPIGIVWLWQVATHVEHPGWLLWYLAATGATIGLLLLVVLLVIVGVVALF